MKQVTVELAEVSKNSNHEVEVMGLYPMKWGL